MNTKQPPERRLILVEGIVQGVGFRPFVFNLAQALGVAGYVRNDAEGVTIEAEGEPDQLSLFQERLLAEPPALARIDKTAVTHLPATGERQFKILESRAGGQKTALVSADMSICRDCLDEIRDRGSRRFGYAFTNCTNCGPRFTITANIPYDRPNTTMAAFGMCPACAREYRDPSDRRFHAQPIACPACGPHLILIDAAGEAVAGAAIEQAARLLTEGKILAVKGLGGYHLACDALNEKSVQDLRGRKHREDKPFACMAADLDVVRSYCRVRDQEAALMTTPRRPIVLLERRPDHGLGPLVAPGNSHLGFMLAYTPLHYLLLDALSALRPGRPAVLVMTSGNVSDEPIAYKDAAAFTDLHLIADYFLTHDREIHIRCDDSVLRVPESGPEYIIRRARGFAPEPVRLARRIEKPVLAVGAELKHTFCLAKLDRAFVSHHIGDLENWETMRSFIEGVEHFSRLFEIRPEVVAYDLHPEYLSTKWAREQLSGDGTPLPGLSLDQARGIGIQHHHAHIASCLADNGVTGPVIGLALDGTGWGPDGAIWGCEVLVADLAGFRRAGHLKYVPLPGGAAAIKQPWRMAAVYLQEAFGDEAAGLPLEMVRRSVGRWGPVLKMAASGLNSLPTSSAGRLFDAVAAVVGLRDEVNYEGQAAIELEQMAGAGEPAYPCPVTGAGPDQLLAIDGVELFKAAVRDLLNGATPGKVSASFHAGLAEGLVAACGLVRQETGLAEVALSGGTFQNQMLLGLVTRRLEQEGFKVWRHRTVPANDAGISLGQCAIAADSQAK